MIRAQAHKLLSFFNLKFQCLQWKKKLRAATEGLERKFFLSDHITNFSPLGCVLPAEANKQAKRARSKISDQPYAHEGEALGWLPSALLEEKCSPPFSANVKPRFFQEPSKNMTSASSFALRRSGYVQPPVTA